ncbi:MAG: hypothetical protein CVU46_08230 [Chloroflexi bacterium HGW-Chloroflexi-8]|nr:MAG: hypothetical protein CVU46_08230 [Chloroflexi bacterium HGW-Chloroflexi-8]
MRRIPLFWLSISFIAGIFFAQYINADIVVWKVCLLVAVIGLVVELCFGHKWGKYVNLRMKLPLAFFLLAVFFIAGGLRYKNSMLPPEPSDLAFYNQSGKVEIEGIICDDPQRKENSIQLVICAQSIETVTGQARAVKGKTIMRSQPADWNYGDRVSAFGALSDPPEDENFSYRFYLSTRGINSLMEYPYLQRIESRQGNWLKDKIFRIRQTAYQSINQFLPQPEAGLLAGVLLGIENDIPYDLEKAFQDTGTAHIIAISGFNMTLLAGLVLGGFRKSLSIWWAGLLSILTISFYAIMVGASPPVVRAALMSGLAMSAHLIGRKQAGPFTLTLTVAVMCLFNPLYLWDTGFQLSVMATLGLVLYADRLGVWFENLAGKWFPEPVVNRIKGPVSEYFLFTLAAQITTLPVIIFQFEQISISSIIANPLILPVQPLVMMIGGLAVLASFIFHPLGQILAYLAWLPLVYTIRLVDLLANISFGEITIGKISPFFVLIFYLLLFLFTLPNKLLPDLSGPRKLVFMSMGFLTVTLLIWNVVLSQTSGRLRVVIFPEPNQGAVLIQTPSGKRILINGGSGANSLSVALNKYIPAVDRHLDLAIFSNMDRDQNQAFPLVIKRFPVHLFLWAVEDPHTSITNQIATFLMEEEISSAELDLGVVIDLGDGIRLTKVVQGEKDTILLLEYGKLRVFFGGDDPQEWDSINPLAGAVVVLPLGEQNLERWQDFRTLTTIHHQQNDTFGVSTWQKGTIQLWSDGNTLWLGGDS